jgi:murein DD-endopeptidase MepM/ murein hydrolase activator NlpD
MIFLKNYRYHYSPFANRQKKIMIPFKDFLTISIGALICVSCATPQTNLPQSNPVPVIHQPSVIERNQIPTQPTAPVYRTKPSFSTPIPTQAVAPKSSQSTLLNQPKPPKIPKSLEKLRNKTVVPGGIAWVPLDNQGTTPPNIHYQQRRVVVLHDGKQWIALVGIDLSAKLGRHTVIDQQTRKRYSFTVKHKKYKTQRIRLKNKRKVNPNRKDLQRIARERKRIRAALGSPWQATTTSPLPLTQPVRGRFSSPFGLRRFFNGQRRNPHSGLDIAAPQGTSIVAAANGLVVDTGHYFYTGKTVIINHGQGIVTLYGHLHSIAVKNGQTVKRRQKIGTIGKTGRATGPHLHWGVAMNYKMVNPKLVMR